VSIVLGSSDPDALYAPGETITLTATGTADGGELSAGILGAITYPDAAVNVNAALNTQNLMPTFTSLLTLTCTTARCLAFNQINAGGASAPGISGFVLSSTKFVVDNTTPLGTIINFNWQTTPTTQQLNFFGISPIQPGYSVTVAAIPEPTTAALIGLGLFGLAFAGRRRS
jgi:hypothetical protein